MRSLLLCLIACDASIAQPTRAQTIAIGGHPSDLAAGDLDNDGRTDLVIVDRDGSLSIRLNRADWVAGHVPRTRAHLVALGDVDKDGKLDIVTTDHDSGDVGLFFGDGDGRFRAAPSIRAVTAAKPHNHGLIVRDLDGDGDADVIVADQTAKQLVALRSNGKTLEVAATIALPHQAYPPAAGDLDGDGHVDVVVPLISDRAVAVLRGDGRGGFEQPRTFVTTRERPYGIALGDIDGNGTLDALVSHDDTDTIVVMTGDGKGALVESRAIELPGRIGTPVLVDIDGDNALDLVGAGSGRIVIAEHRLSRIRSEPSSGWRVLAADFNADGKLDIAATDPDHGNVRIIRAAR